MSLLPAIALEELAIGKAEKMKIPKPSSSTVLTITGQKVMLKGL